MLETVFRKKNRRGLYVAEIGLNHNGNMDTAVRMVHDAASAGADAVKFQTLVPELLNSPYTASLLKNNSESYADTGTIDFFKKFILTYEEYKEIKKAAEHEGVVFFSSAFDEPSVELLERLGVPLYKIASSEVTNHRLIRIIAETGKPALLSTGISTEEEIDSAIACFKERSTAELVLLHCVSLYPPGPEHVNLGRITALRERYNIEVGYSDHRPDNHAAFMAAALGAGIFEKHFTVDRNFDCPDKDVSLTPDEFADLIRGVETTILMMGKGTITYDPAESGTARAARRSFFARKFIPAGKNIEEDDLIALRPGTGVPPSMARLLIGRKSRIDIQKDHMIRTEFLYTEGVGNEK